MSPTWIDRLLDAIGDAHTPRALVLRVAEALADDAPTRVELATPEATITATARDGQWTAASGPPPTSLPRSPRLRALRRGRKLVLPVTGGALTIWLGSPASSVAAGDTDGDGGPASLETLSRVVSAALDHHAVLRRVARLSRRAHSENRALRAAVDRLSGPGVAVARSEPMRRALERVDQVARFDTPVLLTGETGSGKEVLARAIHERSVRATGPFIQINCGAIAETLIESELFGHERGAFTGAERVHRGVFERAEGGTLLLDEIGDLAPAAQVKLLRVLQDRTAYRVGGETPIAIDVRVIAATHRPLREMVAAGAFRQDLFYRLDVFAIEVPPLRRRAGDLPILAAELLDSIAARLRIAPPPLDAETLERLEGHHWPGNVRELANVLEAALVAGGGERLVLPAGLGGARGSGAIQPLDETIREAIERALAATGGKIYGPGGAAELLELHPATLQSKMRKLGIARARFAGNVTARA